MGNSFKIKGVRYLTMSGIRDEYKNIGYTNISLNSIYSRVSRVKEKTAVEKWGIRIVVDPRDGVTKFVISSETFRNVWANRPPTKLKPVSKRAQLIREISKTLDTKRSTHPKK